ncbi:MAG: hypothetical protein MRJ68_05315 [Nitrospira sp.]|nr:hypothetical protein [Nitrospira sp.]
MPYTYDYTSAAIGDESALRRSWRFAKMTLTRWTRAKTFVFDRKSYPYLYHFCNKTWKNERGVEIPIFRELLLEHDGQRVLEVGNVLSHYFPIHHDVVDKYEVAPGVINQDIVEFVPPERYDLILSISTLEHVGWDESRVSRPNCCAPSNTCGTDVWLPADRSSPACHLATTSSSTGCSATVRAPLRHSFLKRVSTKNYWVESDWNNCKDVPYGRFVAHAIVIGTIQN